ncbi:hypothetical protein CWI84_11675 [Idiomarina tyrosinivorans]|uniref:Uncharacterized protein n=1 Tax=Idiomarina tyrosinivorans TaxID=1445662 RepID=A0A432ZGW4_9GAMM|nr:hypothetical protein [Idiomarina tyrosinivorans]RUO76542.1 hypothetical protein CWI84_11675 [Idiomarina tyrosinivorans]
MDIRTEGHTQIDGAVIANIDEEGNDGGNLSLSTGTLGYSDIEDHDQEESTYLNVGFTMGDDNSTNQTESGTNYTASGHYNNHDKEQINRATVGEGTITVRDNTEQDTSDLNRDTDLAQEVTKDDSQNTNLYASTTAADSLTNLAENPSEQLNQWKDNVASVASTDAWGQVGENASDALEDTYNAGAAVATDKDLGVGNFWVSLDSTHKMTQLKNDLTRTAEGQALLARLTSDDPDQRLAAEAELGHRAQEKFGIDPSDINFYTGSETDSDSLASTLTMKVKGATVSEEGHEEYGNIYIDVENADDALDLNETLGHEVYESVTLQTGGENDDSQEAIAGLVGEQLASRLDDALDGGLGDVNTSDLANTNTVQTGTQQSHSVGGADVEYNNACLYANICNNRDQAEADMLSLWRSDDPEKQAEGERIYSVLQEYDQLQKEDVGAFFDRVGEEGIKGAIVSMLEESYDGLKAVADNPALLKEGLQEVEDDLTGKNGEARQMLAWDNLNQSLKTAAITLPVGGGLAGSAKTLDKVDDVVDVVDGKDFSNAGQDSDFYKNPAEHTDTGKVLPDTPTEHDAYKDGLVNEQGEAVNWGNPDTLIDHVERHGSDFGITDPTEYGEFAQDFFNNRNAPGVETIVDSNGVTKVYDPATNTFASYNPDGTTKTIYKPAPGDSYWENQKLQNGGTQNSSLDDEISALQNIGQKQREKSGLPEQGGIPADGVDISNNNARQLLESRGASTSQASTTVDSFDGQIKAYSGERGDEFVITESTTGSGSGFYVTRDSAGGTPQERIKNLALPNTNTAEVENKVELGSDQVLLEGKVKGQQGQPWAHENAVGGGQQVVTNGDIVNKTGERE